MLTGEVKDWNLVILVVDGTTLNNLMGADGDPVVPKFGQIRDLIRHVSVKNIRIVFTGVTTRKRQDEIDAWLRKHNFFSTKINFRHVMYVPETRKQTVVKNAREKCFFSSYSHIAFICDDFGLLQKPREKEKTMSRILLSPTAESLKSLRLANGRGVQHFESWGDLVPRLEDILRKR